MENTKYIDMHIHSTFSDGTLTPTEIVSLSNKIGLAAIALTDHDTTDGINEAIIAGKDQDIEIIPGIEFAAFTESHKEIHILGYFINYNNQKLKDHTYLIKNSRYCRNIKMIEKLNSIGIVLNYEELVNSAGGDIITRAHYAKLIVKKGYVKNVKQAFEKYISLGCVGYVERELFTAKETIKIIKNSGGFAVLAHPTLYNISFEQIEYMANEFKTYGLDGIESMYSTYNTLQVKSILHIADKLNLKITGGSDFHGENKPDIKLGVGFGNLKIPYNLLQTFQNNKKRT